jgi:hypothetical protein
VAKIRFSLKIILNDILIGVFECLKEVGLLKNIGINVKMILAFFLFFIFEGTLF